MNKVEKHLKKYAPKDEVPYPHPQCKAAGLVLPSGMDFKNYTATVHLHCPALRASLHVSFKMMLCVFCVNT